MALPGSSQATIPYGCINRQSTSMNGGTLKGTQAVSIHSVGDQQERYGIVWFQANTNDAGDGKITLSNYAVTKQNFPSLTDNGAAFAQTIASNAGALPPLNDQKIKDDITLGKSNPNPGGEGAGVKVLNDPPAIIHSNDPRPARAHRRRSQADPGTGYFLSKRLSIPTT